MRRLWLPLAALAALLIAAAPGHSAKRPGARLVKVGTFEDPVYVTAPRGDRHRVFVVEQAGRIEVVKDGQTLARPFLDIRGIVHQDGEMGLLSMAFAPDYATSRRFYVFYTDEKRKQRIVEYRSTSDDVADPDSARVLLVENDPDLNNNGGQLQFGPDGYLYIANGDGGGDEYGPPDQYHTAQNLGSLFGKILRIDPTGGGDYTVPADNPFQGDGQRPEIYLYGVRNPWRFSFDHKTGAMVIADVGQETQEEIDFFKRGQARGANLGWPVFEGRVRRSESDTAPGAVKPVLTFKHGTGDFCAITGGYVSRDPHVKATYGRYLFSDFCFGDIHVARLKQPRGTSHKLGLKVGQLVSFGEDGRGRVYAVSIDGPVYRIAARH
jgi:glucose/arabinose dehydrogenase